MVRLLSQTRPIPRSPDGDKNRTTDINTFQCRFPPIENNWLNVNQYEAILWGQKASTLPVRNTQLSNPWADHFLSVQVQVQVHLGCASVDLALTLGTWAESAKSTSPHCRTYTKVSISKVRCDLACWSFFVRKAHGREVFERQDTILEFDQLWINMEDNIMWQRTELQKRTKKDDDIWSHIFQSIP